MREKAVFSEGSAGFLLLRNRMKQNRNVQILTEGNEDTNKKKNDRRKNEPMPLSNRLNCLFGLQC